MSGRYLRILSAEELTRVHEASLQLLERVGMRIDHEGARAILHGAGARVDGATGVVRFPPALVEEKLALVPRTLEYHGRSAEYDIRLEPDGPIYSRVAGGATGYNDLASGKWRSARIADMREFAIVGDALPTIHVTSVLTAEDVPAETSELHAVKTLLQHQRRCIATNALTLENLRAMIEMLVAVRGSREEVVRRPPIHLLLCMGSPLHILEDVAAQLLLACEYGIPTDNPVMPVAGATSPITLAGTLAQVNAEFLGSMTLAQSARAGHPMPYFVDPAVGDMRTGGALLGSPENGLLIAAIMQLGSELYGFPPQGTGLVSDGFDYCQNLFQKAQNTLFQVMAGGKLIIGAGNIETVMTFDPVVLTLDDELVRVARRWAAGLSIDDDALALEPIERVGYGGQFLDDDHTVEHLRELFDSALFARGSRDAWTTAGARDLVTVAREKTRSILEKHEVEPLPEDVVRELDRIVPPVGA